MTIGLSVKFDRLVKEMDRIAAGLDEKVVMQIGYTDYVPKNAEYFSFMPLDEIENFYRLARVVVCHAGIGTIMTAMKYSKQIVLVPRFKRYGEVHNDHQLEIATEFEKEGIAVIVRDIRDLDKAIRNISDCHVNESIERFKQGNKLINGLKEYLMDVESENTARARY